MDALENDMNRLPPTLLSEFTDAEIAAEYQRRAAHRVRWDAAVNRHYEPVERAAKQIYESFPYDGLGQKPAWTDHGNSTMQDKARDRARELLRKDGHVPAR